SVERQWGADGVEKEVGADESELETLEEVPEEVEEEDGETEEERLAREEAAREAHERAVAVAAAEREAAARAWQEWVSIPAGQRLVDAAWPMLVDKASAYTYAIRGTAPHASINGNYLAARARIGAWGSYEDCGSFIATVVRSAGIDTVFPRLTTGVMMAHMERSAKWTGVPNTGDIGALLPGDILVNTSHIFIYLGGTMAAHARLDWALPYAFDIYTPFVRPEEWPEFGTPEWEAYPEEWITMEQRMSSGGQFRDGVWQNSSGVYRIYRAGY
ncbi:hypothetical protein FWH09_02900, partial [Candidatus Saccharibacteria bacterium]|nr:hypothetical protein [Candidatus Saccharibacteria bacterium]